MQIFQREITKFCTQLSGNLKQILRGISSNLNLRLNLCNFSHISVEISENFEFP